MNETILLSTAYLPPSLYFKKILHAEKIIIDRSEHFVKQTFRNRCSIYGANGQLDLIIPLERSTERTPIGLKKISYHFDWQTLHWRSLQSAYRSSPFFEYFEEDFKVFYEKKFDYLFDFNLEMLVFLCRILKIKFQFELTDQYLKQYDGVEDLRQSISPKSMEFNTQAFPLEPYYQVFSGKYGYIPNLSVIDLLFHVGLKTVDILEQ